MKLISPHGERIGDLHNCDFPALFRPARAVDGEQETT
jgi:hypothetical protein